MWAQIAGVFTPLRKTAREDIEWINQSSTSRGQPVNWANVEGDYYRISPYPDATYLVRVIGHFKFPTLVNDADSNAWLTISNAYFCVKARAKAQVMAEKTRNAREASVQMQTASERLDALYRATTRKTAYGRIQAHT
jgi:hypothetical protein